VMPASELDGCDESPLRVARGARANHRHTKIHTSSHVSPRRFAFRFASSLRPRSFAPRARRRVHRVGGGGCFLGGERRRSGCDGTGAEHSRHLVDLPLRRSQTPSPARDRVGASPRGAHRCGSRPQRAGEEPRRGHRCALATGSLGRRVLTRREPRTRRLCRGRLSWRTCRIRPRRRGAGERTTRRAFARPRAFAVAPPRI
jgi:hypothetical protein